MTPPRASRAMVTMAGGNLHPSQATRDAFADRKPTTKFVVIP